MNPGLMRTPLLIKFRNITVSSYGQPLFTYTGTTYIAGQIKECSGEEKLNHHKMDQIVTHKITTNFYPGISTGDRFTASVSRDSNNASFTKTYEIISAIDYRQEGHTLNFICREVDDG